MTTRRILICGDRNWTCHTCIDIFVGALPFTAVVIDGCARGADSFAHSAALRKGLLTIRFPAKWDIFGKAAGPIRNRQMIIDGQPTEVVAFHNNIASSKGTKHMIAISRKEDIPTEVRKCPHRTSASVVAGDF